MPSSIAIVTGVSRQKGLGKAICLELAHRGCDIFFTYWTAYDQSMPWGIRADEPNQIEAEIKDLGVRCASIELDLTSDGAVDVLMSRVVAEMGPPNILINNATYSTESSVNTLNAEILDAHYFLNIKATTLLTIAFIRQFDRGAKGSIINLTSGQSLGQMPEELAYAMTKSAIENLTYALSSTIAQIGITINAVNPGPNDTGWIDESIKEAILERFPKGRIGRQSDTAKLIGFLTSADAEWITGQIIHSEGGFLR